MATIAADDNTIQDPTCRAPLVLGEADFVVIRLRNFDTMRFRFHGCH